MVRIHVGCIVKTNVWRFIDAADSNDWVKGKYGRQFRTATVEGKVLEAKGRGKWEVEWQWQHPNASKRKGESPSAHLTIVRTEIDDRRQNVRAAMNVQGAGAQEGDETKGDGDSS